MENIKFKFLYKDEKVESAKFKKITEIFRSEYEFLDIKELELIRSRLEIRIDTIKNSHTLQIIASLTSLFPIMLFNYLLFNSNSLNIYLKDKIKSNTTNLQVQNATNDQIYKIISNYFDIVYIFIILVIILIIVFLISFELYRLGIMSMLSKRLYVINKLIKERISLNSNWQLWK